MTGRPADGEPDLRALEEGRPTGGPGEGSDGERIDASLAGAPIMQKDGYPYLIHPLMDGVPRADPGLLRAWSAWARRQAPTATATVLLAPEAMALPLAATLACDSGIPYLVARKRSYGLPGEHAVTGVTGYGRSELHLNDIRAGDRVLIVDDVLSTGGTLEAILDHLLERGSTVCGVLVFVDKGDRAEAIQDRSGIPVHVMRTIRIVDGKVQVVGRG